MKRSRRVGAWRAASGLRGCLLVVLSLLAAGCGRPAEEALTRASPRTPVILISLDTVRADTVSAPGAEARTPHLTQFRAASVRFRAAYSEIPFTLPAHATMLTGIAPDGHGLFGPEDRLAAGQPTLAEILGAAGYRTAAVVSSDWLRPGFGFGRGFDSYDEVPLALSFADDVTQQGMRRLDEIVDEGGAPFLFLHYYDAHSDFELDGNKRAYFASPAASGELAERCRRGQCAPGGECATGYLLWANRHATEVGAEDRSCLSASYEAGVSDLDAAFGRLRAQLEERGLYQRALIAVTSDHGEEFGEHGQFIHAQPFVESLAIPLWIKLPGRERAGVVIERTAQLADVVPTLLGRLGHPGLGGMSGVDLFSEDVAGERLVLGQNKYRPERYSAQRGGWKLIHDFVEGRSSLFDLGSDAGEVVNVAEQHPSRVTELLAALEERRDELQRLRAAGDGSTNSESPASEVLSPEARRRLEALGYVN